MMKVQKNDEATKPQSLLAYSFPNKKPLKL